MRDILLLTIVIAGCLAAIRRPWIGVMVWTWLSIMNPHRYTYGIAYDAPIAAATAGCTLLGLLMTRDKDSPFKGAPVVLLTVFMAWMTASWIFGLDAARDYEQWKKVMKIDVMILVSLILLHSRQHIMALMWVCTGSLALLGIKGGVFTVLHGGDYRVWGPPGSFIADNNEFALALIMTIPLLRFLQMQVHTAWKRHALLIAMLLCGAAALGSHSRGALLAITAMSALLWWRGRSRFAGGVLIVAVALALISFMPDNWESRMGTISTYQADASAMGRINAWHNAWGIAQNFLFGVGFNTLRPELFARFAPNPDAILAAHSIYFQVMGNHGLIGLLLFISIGVATWRQASWLRLEGKKRPETQWCADLGSMCQVALAGYAVGGAFLSMSYFDLPYNIMVMVVLTRVWLIKQHWKTEQSTEPRWMRWLGHSSAGKAG